jgi:metal-responsive CopG/Arc/MetJ family transcriptional regulator
MKRKISITLSKDLLRQIDRLIGEEGNRSQLIERAIREYLANTARRERDDTDREILNRCADSLNEEALDVSDYQAGQ